MRFRRRYQVVVEGISGQAAAQRSVISEHRSEAEARDAAARERARLEVIHGGQAAAWRILVMLDDTTLAEEVPDAEGADLLDAATAAAVAAAEAEAEAHAAGAQASPAAPGAQEATDAPAEAEAGEADEAAEPPPPEPPPEGPVPDWVIQRFEESIARRGDREAGPDASTTEDAA